MGLVLAQSFGFAQDVLLFSINLFHRQELADASKKVFEDFPRLGRSVFRSRSPNSGRRVECRTIGGCESHVDSCRGDANFHGQGKGIADEQGGDGQGSASHSPADEPPVALFSLAEIVDQPIEWVVEGVIPRGELTLITENTSDPNNIIFCRFSGVVQSCNACWKSAIRSSGCSIPTETRSVEAVIPASRRAASVIDA